MEFSAVSRWLVCGTQPRAASRGHGHDVSGWRGPTKATVLQGPVCRGRQRRARGFAAPSGRAETGTSHRPAQARARLPPPPSPGDDLPGAVTGSLRPGPRARCPGQVLPGPRASAAQHRLSVRLSVRAKPHVRPRNQQQLWTRFRSCGDLLLLVTPGVRKPWWTRRAPGGWGVGVLPAGHAHRGGEGPGSRPEEASGSSTLLWSGTRHARVMHGVAWGRVESFQRAEGRLAGVPSEGRQASGRAPSRGVGPSPAGDRRWQRRGPPKVCPSEGPAVTSARIVQGSRK